MQKRIKKVLSQLHFKNYRHYQFFIRVIETLINDKDEHHKNHSKGSIYDFLGENLHEEPETIISRLKTIRSEFSEEEYSLLGFGEKPKSVDLLHKLVELSKQEIKSDEVEITDEHKI